MPCCFFRGFIDAHLQTRKLYTCKSSGGTTHYLLIKSSSAGISARISSSPKKGAQLVDRPTDLSTAVDGRAGNGVRIEVVPPDVDEDTWVVGAVGAWEGDARWVGGAAAGDGDLLFPVGQS